MGKTRYFKPQKYLNLQKNNKVRRDKKCSIVATCLWWGG